MASPARFLSLVGAMLATLACAPDAHDLPDEPERRAVVAESRPVVAESYASGQTQPAAPDAAVFAEFTDRVKQYVKLRKMLEENLPELKKTTDTANIAEHQKALAVLVQGARMDAKPGDIFTPPAAKQFRRIISADLIKRSDADAEAVVEEIPDKLRLRVNEAYPDGAPLATMPPKLLLRLPPLPEEVEYRFLGRHLILRDVGANVIVDFIYNVLPPDKT